MLKQLVLARKIQAKRSELDKLQADAAELEQRREALKQREAELEAAVAELRDDSPAEDTAAVDAAVAEHLEQVAEVDKAEQANRDAQVNLQGEIDGLQAELDGINAQIEKTPEERSEKIEIKKEENGGGYTMRKAIFDTPQERSEFFARDEVKAYLTEVRSAMREKRAITNAGLTIPVVMLDLIRKEIARTSKLLPYVRVRSVGGTARQNIAGAIPEAVWTEMCANINELTMAFNQVEVDGYKVGGYIAICNAVLEDSDYDLAVEIITAIGGAIGKALDKAILFGTGVKMPVGVATRLAQTSQPANWGTHAPAWTDLHSTNVVTLNIGSATGIDFFAALIEKLGLAKDVYHLEGLAWVMNRKTHIKLMTKALQFNSNAALLSNTRLMPVLGGDVVEMDDDEIQDNEIIGGFFGNYLLAERAGVEFASSDIPLFLQDQTVYKGTARYDGQPMAGEAFVAVNFANTSPETAKTFPVDYANADLNDLTITAAASASSAGKTVLTVSGTIAQSDPDLQYKLGDIPVAVGDAAPAGFADLTSGTTEITAAAGKKITVIELDANDRIVSAGTVVSVPKAAG